MYYILVDVTVFNVVITNNKRYCRICDCAKQRIYLCIVAWVENMLPHIRSIFWLRCWAIAKIMFVIHPFKKQKRLKFNAEKKTKQQLLILHSICLTSQNAKKNQFVETVIDKHTQKPGHGGIDPHINCSSSIHRHSHSVISFHLDSGFVFLYTVVYV